MDKAVSEGPVDFQQRCIERWPDQKELIKTIMQTYIHLQFSGQSITSKEQASALKKLSADIRQLSLN